MSLLQCFGCRTRRTASQYSTPIPFTQSQNTGNTSNRNRTYGADNEASTQVNGTTARILDKAIRLIVRLDRQLSNSMTSPHNAPRSTGQHVGRSVSPFNDSVEPTTRD